MKTIQVKPLMLCAFFAALTAALSQIAVPIGPVPINLATLSVFCAGLLLGGKYGALSQLVYVLLGLAGVPVFAMFRGGAGVLMGPTGGYILGYVAAAWLTGVMAKRFENRAWSWILAMAAGYAICLLLGTTWFIHISGTGLRQALSLCVIPFLPGDAIKIITAAVITARIRGAVQSQIETV
jgi:biotin transport system substrate-specific component